MPTGESVQRRKESRRKGDAHVIRLQIKDRMGNPRWITADLLNDSGHGIGIAVRTPLTIGSQVVIRGDLGESQTSVVNPAIVKWCTEKINGAFHAGLELGENGSASTSESAESPRRTTDEPDWYEVMQLSPNADAETVARVYRILAQRYHPDSATGNQEAFLRLCEAHQVLGDPERRAQYDARHGESKRLHWQIFDRASIARTPDDERRKRRAILEALYAKALLDPERSAMSVFELEELLGCPREHLEAALWYLKGKGYVKRADNGRCAITVSGFDEVEGNPQQREHHDQNLLEAGKAS